MCIRDRTKVNCFFLSEGDKGLLDGDPGEKEATNDDNSIVALHPDTMEHLQLSYSTRILPRLPRGQSTLGSRPSFTVWPIRDPLEPVEQSPPRSRPPRRGLQRCAASPPRSRVADLPSESRPTPPRPSPPQDLVSGGNSASLEATPRQLELVTHLLTYPTDRSI